MDACSGLAEGQNCSYAVARSSIRIGMCHFVGPGNHSVLACISEDSGSEPDPACQRGLFHSSSRACCASRCDACREAAQRAESDPACSVEHILRLAPFCSLAGPPCLVGHALEISIPEGAKTADAMSIPQITSEISKAPSFPPWLSELVLPLATGFIACSCSLALCCYCLREVRSWNSIKTPSSPPSNSRVLGKARARPKERRRRRRAGRLPEIGAETDPAELPPLVEVESASSDILQMEDRDEPYPLVDLWAPPNAGGAEHQELQEEAQESLHEASKAGMDTAGDKLPESLEPVSQFRASPKRSSWHSKWKDMEADLEAALATGPDGMLNDIPQLPRSSGRNNQALKDFWEDHPRYSDIMNRYLYIYTYERYS